MIMIDELQQYELLVLQFGFGYNNCCFGIISYSMV
jgi:hypothetical protein